MTRKKNLYHREHRVAQRESAQRRFNSLSISVYSVAPSVPSVVKAFDFPSDSHSFSTTARIIYISYKPALASQFSVALHVPSF